MSKPAIPLELRRRAARGGTTTLVERRLLASELEGRCFGNRSSYRAFLLGGIQAIKEETDWDAERRGAIRSARRANEADVWEGPWTDDDWQMRVGHSAAKVEAELRGWAARQDLPWLKVKRELFRALQNLK